MWSEKPEPALHDTVQRRGEWHQQATTTQEQSEHQSYEAERCERKKNRADFEAEIVKKRLRINQSAVYKFKPIVEKS